MAAPISLVKVPTVDSYILDMSEETIDRQLSCDADALDRMEGELMELQRSIRATEQEMGMLMAERNYRQAREIEQAGLDPALARSWRHMFPVYVSECFTPLEFD